MEVLQKEDGLVQVLLRDLLNQRTNLKIDIAEEKRVTYSRWEELNTLQAWPNGTTPAIIPDIR